MSIKELTAISIVITVHKDTHLCYNHSSVNSSYAKEQLVVITPSITGLLHTEQATILCKCTDYDFFLLWQ